MGAGKREEGSEQVAGRSAFVEDGGREGWVSEEAGWVYRRCKDVGTSSLSPISHDIAIVSLRYPLSRDTFSAIPAIPQRGEIPTLGVFFYTDISVRYPILQHIAQYLCNTPGKQAQKYFAILSLKVSRDMKSVGAWPLSLLVLCSRLSVRMT